MATEKEAENTLARPPYIGPHLEGHRAEPHYRTLRTDKLPMEAVASDV